MKIHLETRKIEEIFQKFDIFPKNPDLLYSRGDMFFIFFSEKHLKVTTRTSVGRNNGRTSVGGEKIKKFTKSTENFSDGSTKSKHVCNRPHQPKILGIV